MFRNENPPLDPLHFFPLLSPTPACCSPPESGVLRPASCLPPATLASPSHSASPPPNLHCSVLPPPHLPLSFSLSHSTQSRWPVSLFGSLTPLSPGLGLSLLRCCLSFIAVSLFGSLSPASSVPEPHCCSRSSTPSIIFLFRH